jgi:hypothetical protein
MSITILDISNFKLLEIDRIFQNDVGITPGLRRADQLVPINYGCNP